MSALMGWLFVSVGRGIEGREEEDQTPTPRTEGTDRSHAGRFPVSRWSKVARGHGGTGGSLRELIQRRSNGTMVSWEIIPSNGCSLTNHGLTVNRVQDSAPIPDFSVALTGPLDGGDRHELQVLYTGDCNYFGVGIAESNIPTHESPRWLQRGSAWFLLNKGFLCDGGSFEDDSLDPGWSARRWLCPVLTAFSSAEWNRLCPEILCLLWARCNTNACSAARSGTEPAHHPFLRSFQEQAHCSEQQYYNRCSLDPA